MLNVRRETKDERGRTTESPGETFKVSNAKSIVKGVIGVAIVLIFMAASVAFVDKVTVSKGDDASFIPPVVMKKGYDNFIAVYANRPTVVEVWDYAVIDGDVAGVNGVPIPVDGTKKKIILPPGITHVNLTAVKDGSSYGITPAARSEAGSMTYMRATPGEQVVIPCVKVW
jgi:hypothetical protein